MLFIRFQQHSIALLVCLRNTIDNISILVFWVAHPIKHILTHLKWRKASYSSFCHATRPNL